MEAKAAGLPRTEKILVNYGLDIIKKKNDFEIGLMEWFRKAEAENLGTTLRGTSAASALRNQKISTKHTMKNTTLLKKLQNPFPTSVPNYTSQSPHWVIILPIITPTTLFQ